MSPTPAAAPLWRDLSIAASLGALQSLSFTHTNGWWLQLLVVGWLAWRVGVATVPRAALLGLVFGTAWLASGVWWLFISMHRYGGLPAWLAVLAVAALCAFLSLYLSAAMAAFARWRCGRPGADALLFASLWLLAELARAVIFTGFPWVASGYAHVDGPLAVLAPWIGVYGMGFVGALIMSWAVGGWRVRVQHGRGASARLSGGVAAAGGVAALIGLALTAPAQFTRETRTLTVTLLQGNVAQNEKFSVEHLPAALDWTREQLLAAPGTLVLAPETVIPLLPDQLDPAFWQPLLAHFRAGPQWALLGLPLGDPVAGYTNSVAGLSAASAVAPDGFYRYDKHHLVPFGEFIPWGFRWFTNLMNIPLGDFNRGPRVAPSFDVAGERVAPNICYEDLFGEELAARFADEATAPTVLANVSNIGWFGETVAVAQHLHISRLRALEFQRPMLRATNTGATVIIDHHGRVTAALPPFTQGVLNGTVQGRQGLTPFAVWASVAGVWPLAVGAVGVLLAAAIRQRRAARAPRPDR